MDDAAKSAVDALTTITAAPVGSRILTAAKERFDALAGEDGRVKFGRLKELFSWLVSEMADPSASAQQSQADVEQLVLASETVQTSEDGLDWTEFEVRIEHDSRWSGLGGFLRCGVACRRSTTIWWKQGCRKMRRCRHSLPRCLSLIHI